MKARIIRTADFRQAWEQLTPQMQRIVDNKIRRLGENPAHPSLKAHRLRQVRTADVWVCYITVNKRLLYQHKGNTIYLWNVGEHSLVERVHLRNFDRLA